MTMPRFIRTCRQVRVLTAPDAEEPDSGKQQNPEWQPDPAVERHAAVRVKSWDAEHYNLVIDSIPPGYAVLRIMDYPAWIIRRNGVDVNQSPATRRWPDHRFRPARPVADRHPLAHHSGYLDWSRAYRCSASAFLVLSGIASAAPALCLELFLGRCIGLTDAFGETRLRPPAQRMDARHIQQLARRAIRLGRIEPQLTREPKLASHQLSQFADRHILARPDIDQRGVLRVDQRPELAIRKTASGRRNASARSSVYRNSRRGVPVPHTSM